MTPELQRLIQEHGAMRRVLDKIDAANARRANALVQDWVVRNDYELSMGAALDDARRLIDDMRAGKPVK